MPSTFTTVAMVYFDFFGLSAAETNAGDRASNARVSEIARLM